jgi:hypothetical protein
MTDQFADDERTALILGELPPDLGPDAVADVALLAEVLALPSAWAEPRATLEDLVVHAVLGAERTAVASVTTLRPAAVPQHPAIGRRSRRTRARLPAAAAVLVATAITGGVLLGHRDNGPDFKGVLTASAIAPGAHGSADMYKTDAGFRVELDARGLPKLAADEYYEAWLRNPDGVAVPIGTFSANGGDVTLWSGVSPEQFPSFSVTIETADNNQHSSGRRVLVGDVHA